MMDNSLYEVTHSQDTRLLGKVISIHISSIEPINYQSCDVQTVTIEYEDKIIIAKHVPNKDLGSIHLSQLDKNHNFSAGRQVAIDSSDLITYDHSTYENGELDSVSFLWNDTWLHIFRMEYNLAFTRSSCDLTAEKCWPSASGEPTLMLR